MSKFIYKFEKVKHVKETLEKKVQKEISAIDMLINEQNIKLEEVLSEKEKLIREISAQKNIKAAELQFMYKALQLFEINAKKIVSEIEKLEQQKLKKQHELEQRSKEHKIFETLEEKYQADFNTDQNHLEQKTMDEIANVRFLREE